MLAIIADTHGTTDHRLAGRTLSAVRDADLVVHAGDFTTEAVYDAIDREADQLVAVAGNNDEPALQSQLPDERTVEWAGHRLVVVHGHQHTETSLSMLARQEAAAVAVVGHSHRPELAERGDVLLVNPGSHADPRRYRPGHAEVEASGDGLRVSLCDPNGDVVTEVIHRA